MARPLHELTCNGAESTWNCKFQAAYPGQETGPVNSAVIPLLRQGDLHPIGVVLSQPQEDGHLYPIAYASRALSPQERSHAIAGDNCGGVWAVPHFHSYLYGHSVTVLTATLP